MSFGVGLGGFVRGMRSGMEMREAMDAADRRKQLEARQDEEYNREKKQRDEIDAIGIQTKKDFDAQVASGKQKADHFDTFWREQALPKLKEAYLTQGNFEAADKLQKWGEDADVKAGAKLSFSAMFKASNGDYAGALDDALKAGDKKGYLDHGYELVDKTEIVDPKTKTVVGYRLNVKTPDGETVQQDVAAKDIPRLVGTLINPQAAWESYLKKQEQGASDQRELDMYEKKKGIDRAYEGGGKTRSDAIKSLRKRFPSNDPTFSGTPFDDLPRDQQEKLVDDEVGFQRGGASSGTPGQVTGPAPSASGMPGIGIGSGAPQPTAAAPSMSAPARNVVVDKMTGRVVNPTAVPGLSAPVAAPVIAKPSYEPSAQQQPQSPQARAQEMIQSAQDAISNGERPARVADQLRQAGIPEDQWPSSVTAAVQKEAQTRGLGMVP